MPTTIDWPDSLPFTSYRLDLISRTRTGGPSISGVEQVLAPLSSIWRLNASVQLSSDAQVRAFRAFRAQVQGRYNRVKFQLDAVAKIQATASALANSPGSATAGAIVGATSVAVNKATLGLLAGHWVTINNRLYEVVADTLGAITIQPPLRDVVTTADAIHTAPYFIGRAATDEAFALPVDRIGHAALSLQFVEAFDV